MPAATNPNRYAKFSTENIARLSYCIPEGDQDPKPGDLLYVPVRSGNLHASIVLDAAPAHTDRTGDRRSVVTVRLASHEEVQRHSRR